MKLISVKMYGNPDIKARAILPNEDIKDKNKKQFKATKRAFLEIIYEDNKGEWHPKILANDPDYCYDGATIPFNIGKGDMRLLIPALWHDIICEKKSLVDYNRKLSSLIFKELLLQCGSNKFQAQVKYLAVDTYQRLQKEWKKKRYE